MNTKRLKRVFLALAALPVLFFASCGDDEPGGNEPGTCPNENGGDIRFEIGFSEQASANGVQTNGVQTRAATASDFTGAWENGDEIGIFAVKSGEALTTSGNYIHNVKLTYSSANGGTWTQATPLYWPTTANNITALDFYAYYPYNVSATDPANIPFNVKADQSAAADYSKSDLLTAKTVNKNKADGAVGLAFNHALAMVQVSIPGGTGWGAGVEGFNVTLRNMKAKSTLNLGAVGATPGSGITVPTTGNDATSITMFRLEQPGDANYTTGYTYRALVPAQDVAAGNSLFLFEHEGRQLLTDGALASKLEMTAGQAEKFTRTMPASMIETVKIPAGIFQMGSPFTEPNRQTNETQHQVTLTKDFYMSRYQVTKAQYTAFLNATGVGSDRKAMVNDGTTTELRTLFSESQYDWTPRWNDATQKWDMTKAGDEQHPGDVPMLYVTWYGAKAYAEWAGGSLPTEAQWEYACRAGTTTAYSFGDNASILGDYAWYSANTSGGPGLVGTKLPNPWGLYDMHGNVYEWCSDWYDGNYYSTSPSDDPTGPTAGSGRVLRGGYWGSSAQSCRSAYRDYGMPAGANSYVGFRVAVVP
jgi:formylglycine-generating enzyme required for sulfatase activity